MAIGIALDSTYAHFAGLLPRPAWQRVLAALAALGLPRFAPELGAPRLLDGLRGPVVLLREIGEGIEVEEMDDVVIRASVAALERLDAEADLPASAEPKAWQALAA